MPSPSDEPDQKESDRYGELSLLGGRGHGRWLRGGSSVRAKAEHVTATNASVAEECQPPGVIVDKQVVHFVSC
jgi:hypothetical protein